METQTPPEKNGHQGEGGGQPTKYEPRFNRQATKACLLGATDKDLAELFDVAEATINNWKLQHPKFLESIKKGREDADEAVAKSLYQRALGYSHPEVDIRVVEGEIIQTPIIKKYPPSEVAAIFWLKNRQKEKWRDKQEVESVSKVTIEREMSDAELADLVARTAQSSRPGPESEAAEGAGSEEPGAGA